MSEQKPNRRTLQITIDSELLDEFRLFEKTITSFEELTGQPLPWGDINLNDGSLYPKKDLFETFYPILVGRPEHSGDFTFELSPDDQYRYGISIDKNSFMDVEGYTCKQVIPDLALRERILQHLHEIGLINNKGVKDTYTKEEYEELLGILVPDELVEHIKTQFPNTDNLQGAAMKEALHNYRLKVEFCLR